MVIEAEIIGQPYSGEYAERIYDHESAWNSHGWSFVKFTNEGDAQWCGHFRGQPRRVAVSATYHTVLVLTSDYLFQLDRETGNVIELEEQPRYQNLTVDPNGSFILADHYSIEKVMGSIKRKKEIDSPVQMDMVEFRGWKHGKLEFTCDEFLNWDRHLTLTYDSETGKIEILHSE